MYARSHPFTLHNAFPCLLTSSQHTHLVHLNIYHLSVLGCGNPTPVSRRAGAVPVCERATGVPCSGTLTSHVGLVKKKKTCVCEGMHTIELNNGFTICPERSQFKSTHARAHLLSMKWAPSLIGRTNRLNADLENYACA